jgi:hypothetical protein
MGESRGVAFGRVAKAGALVTIGTDTCDSSRAVQTGSGAGQTGRQRAYTRRRVGTSRYGRIRASLVTVGWVLCRQNVASMEGPRGPPGIPQREQTR